MNIIKDHVDYLKDNPEGYWFKRKLYGWGWTPARPQGWLVILIFLVLVVLLALNLEESMSLKEVVKEFVIPIALLITALIYICYKKGEKPKWQWGKNKLD